METAEPVTGEYTDAEGPRMPLLTAAEVLQTIGYLKRLESLDTTHHGYAASQLAADLARRVASA
ncbi:hypothetical protein [Streptomyces sp. NBC_00233]|uniref:hypothetical protein n=1 Tax=Streptomyces sp. NBC_00233 TaxID=2975686 RepID=UPI00225BC16C|nr:hypothetical protein [Streptomyces sp. NBC_00233]MCX5233132.1 hypothetical protein [Streptomyces sp. NBC_00233]